MDRRKLVKGIGIFFVVLALISFAFIDLPLAHNIAKHAVGYPISIGSIISIALSILLAICLTGINILLVSFGLYVAFDSEKEN